MEQRLDADYAGSANRRGWDYFVYGITRPYGFSPSPRNKKILRDAEQLLKAGQWEKADALILCHSSQSGRLARYYEDSKYKYVQEDLHDLRHAGKLDFEPNSEQIGALTAIGKCILVQARAGSGKTSVIALKVRQLFDKYNFKREEILVLAFNKNAARVFSERINAYLGRNEVEERQNAATFHSFAIRLAQRKETLLDTDEEVAVFIEKVIGGEINKDGAPMIRLVRDYMRSVDMEYESEENMATLRDRLNRFINRAKKLRRSPNDVRLATDDLPDHIQPHIRRFGYLAAEVFAKYNEYKKQKEVVDFDDVLTFASKRIKYEGAACTFRLFDATQSVGNLKCVLIDEFQDFNDLFNDLIQSIRDVNPTVNIYCVGDDWQAINCFAGSDIKFFDHFDRYFPGGRRLLLRINTRSHTDIVEHANMVMEGHGVGGLPQSSKPKGRVYLAATISVLDTAMALAEHFPDKSVCLLSRTSALDGKGRGLVTTSTTHSYKGEQCDIAVVVADRKDFPKNHPDNEYLRILGIAGNQIKEEERRLFYVAVTRAKEELYLIYGEKGHTEFIDTKKWKYDKEVLKIVEAKMKKSPMRPEPHHGLFRRGD